MWLCFLQWTPNLICQQQSGEEDFRMYILVFSPDICSHAVFSGEASAHWEITNRSTKRSFFSGKCPLPPPHLAVACPEFVTSCCLDFPPFVPLTPSLRSAEAPRVSRFCGSQSAQGPTWSHPRYLLGVWMTVLMSLSPESYSIGNHNMWLKKPVKNSLGRWIRYMISYYGSFQLTTRWKKGGLDYTGKHQTWQECFLTVRLSGVVYDFNQF